jgi:hypothetical protein
MVKLIAEKLRQTAEEQAERGRAEKVISPAR